MTMRKIILFVFLCVFGFVGCASGTNPYFTNKNVGGLLGGGAGAYGGSVLCKNCKGTSKVIAIAGGTILGMLLGSKGGEYLDKRDQDRQTDLIKQVLEDNRDGQTTNEKYSKQWKNPNTGQTENHTIHQSVTPHRTYQQPQRNVYLQNDIQRLPNGHPDKWKEYTYSQPQQNTQGGQQCRDYTITVTLDKGLTGGLQDTKQQFFSSCRSPETGWRTLQ